MGPNPSPTQILSKNGAVLIWILLAYFVCVTSALSFAAPCGPFGRVATLTITIELERGWVVSVASKPQAFKVLNSTSAALWLRTSVSITSIPVLREAVAESYGIPDPARSWKDAGANTSHFALLRTPANSQAKAAPSASPASYQTATRSPRKLTNWLESIDSFSGLRLRQARVCSIWARAKRSFSISSSFAFSACWSSLSLA